MFKALIVLGVIGVGLTAVGVIHYQKNGDQINISIDKTKLKAVSKKLIEEGEELIEEAEHSLSDEHSKSAADVEEHVEDEIRSQTQRFNPSAGRR